MEPIGQFFNKNKCGVNLFTILALLSLLLSYVLIVIYLYWVPGLSSAFHQYNLFFILVPVLLFGFFPLFGIISSVISFRRKIYSRLILYSNLCFYLGLLYLGLLNVLDCLDVFVITYKAIRFSQVPFIALTCFCAPILRIIHYIIARLKRGKSDETSRNDVPIFKRLIKSCILSLAPILSGVLIIFLFDFVAGALLFQVILFIGLVLGLVSLTQNFKDDLFKTLVAATGILMCGFFLAILFSDVTLPFILNKSEYANKEKTFDGSSDMLDRTVVIPTLDSPASENTNVIWCSTFQISWNQLKNNVIKGPIQLAGAEEFCNRLNNAKQSAADLESNSYYAAAGVAQEGIIDKIKKEMAKKFPSEEVPDLSFSTPLDLIAYSFLYLEIKFPKPFEQREKEFLFTDSTKKKTDVVSFGVWDEDNKFDKIREQVEVLYYHRPDPNDRYDTKSEFAVDLCTTTEPYQIVLARIPRQQTLSRALMYLEEKISSYRTAETYDPKLASDDVLIMPEMFWRIKHSYDDIIDKEIIHPAFKSYRMTLAGQTIQFKLDRYGVILKSDSRIWIISGIFCPRYFVFDQPFLLYLKKRDAQHPLYVMWVNNAELLTKR